MSIEQRVNPAELNISSLNLEQLPSAESSKDVPFDPVRDLSKAQWDKMERSARKENVDLYLASLQVIEPKRLFEKSDNKKWQKMDKFAKTILRHCERGEMGYDNLLGNFAEMKTLFPERFSQALAEQYRERMAEALRKPKITGRGTVDLDNVLYFKILFPGQEKDLLKDNDVSLLKQDMAQNKGGNWYMFCKSAALLKILFPEEFAKVKITPKNWEAMKTQLFEKLDNCQSGHDCLQYINLAEWLATMAAKEVKFTNHGMELSNNAQISQATPAIPKIKNF